MLPYWLDNGNRTLTIFLLLFSWYYQIHLKLINTAGIVHLRQNSMSQGSSSVPFITCMIVDKKSLICKSCGRLSIKLPAADRKPDTSLICNITLFLLSILNWVFWVKGTKNGGHFIFETAYAQLQKPMVSVHAQILKITKIAMLWTIQRGW